MRALALAMVLLLAGCTSAELPDDGGSGDGASNAPDASDKGPSWSFSTLDGATHTRDQPGSNATVLFFMATWCGTCRSKATMLGATQDHVVGDGVRFLSVGFDPSESAEDIAAWQERYAHDWPHGIDAERTMQRTFGITIQSTVLVLDSDGNVVESFGYGKVTESGLREAIDRALVA